MTYLHLDYIITTILVFSTSIIVLSYLLAPLAFMIFGSRTGIRRICSISKLLRSCTNEQTFKYALIAILVTVFALILTLIFREFALISISEYLRQFVSSNSVRGNFHEFFTDLFILAVLLLLPVSTMLIALLWYSTKKLYKFQTLALAASIWLIVRICFIGVFFIGQVPEFYDRVLVPQLNQVPGQDYYIPGSAFGGLPGLLTCVGVSLISLLISASLVRGRRKEIKYLTFAACLCPVVFLIFGAFRIIFSIITIDFAIMALTLGWVLSITKQSKGNLTDSSDKNPIREASDYDVAISPQSKRGTARVMTVVANLSSLTVMSRTGGFVLAAIVPAILLKWVFHDTLGFRLDGAIGAWVTIWAVALGLGLTTLGVTFFYERQDRARQIAIAAFLCTFAIMIHFPINPLHNIQFSNVIIWSILALGMLTLSMTTILVVGTLALIATVVHDKHLWTWPFWACYMFIYIFVHSMYGSGYETDLSKLDLFSWINMSVIVFVFLFAIPTYFASDRCQGRTLETTPQEPYR